MKQTAMIVAMSCVLLCPSVNAALPCPAGMAKLSLAGKVPLPDRKSEYLVIGLEGSSVSDLPKLREDVALERAVLTVTGQSSNPQPLRVVEVRNEKDGSACLVFEKWEPGMDLADVIRDFSDDSGGGAAVCISQDGKATAMLRIESYASPLINLSIDVPDPVRRERVNVLKAAFDYCKK